MIYSHSQFNSSSVQASRALVEQSLPTDPAEMMASHFDGSVDAAARALADLVSYQRCLASMQHEAAMIYENLLDIVCARPR